jgi:hypothetical protein
VFTPGPNVLVVTFDQGLLAGPLNAANWFVRFSGRVMTVTSANAAGATVVLNTVVGVVQAGANVTSYSPPPFDVVAAVPLHTPAEPFSDFPVT